MLYQLLPFFLAVQTSVINDTWNHGPEYTFCGHVKMIANLDSDNGVMMGNKLIFDLKCRPRLNDTLSCRFEDPKIAKLSVSSSGSEQSHEYKPFGMMRTLFDIKFNENGIDSYVIEKTDPRLPAWALDMTRLLCNQLSVGATIDRINDSTFKALENFTTGECEVEFSVNRISGKSISSDVELNDQEFKLVGLEELGKLEEETIEIVKKRDVDDCLRCTDYFYGSRYTFGIVYRDVFTKLKSSISRLIISNSSFVAGTANGVELFGEDRNRLGDVTDHIILKLKSVLPAKEELPILKNPVNMEVIANRPGSPHV